MITLPMSHNGHIMGWNGHWLGRTGYASYEPFTAYMVPHFDYIKSGTVNTACVISSYEVYSATGGGLKRLDKFDLWSPRLIECGFISKSTYGYFGYSKSLTSFSTSLNVIYNGYKYGSFSFYGRYSISGDIGETYNTSDTYTGQFAKSGITPDNYMMSKTSVYTSYYNSTGTGGCQFNPAYCKSIVIENNCSPEWSIRSGFPTFYTVNNSIFGVTGKIGME